MNHFETPSPLQELKSDFLREHKVQLFIKRDDLIHGVVSGNKWRKLKYNLEEAKNQKRDTILTFGGAFSNHLIATATAGRLLQFKTIGVIRGERPQQLSRTLDGCEQNGMELYFVSRERYKEKESDNFLKELELQFGVFYLIQEGGANELGVKGCEEIVKEVDQKFDVICCSAGTATTASGILRSLHNQQLYIFPALKGVNYLKDIILNYQDDVSKIEQMHFFETYHFGGYAKVNQELIDFCKNIHRTYQLKLDLVYTAKMFYGLFALIESGHFLCNSKIVALHTGGLQGNQGFEKRLGIRLF